MTANRRQSARPFEGALRYLAIFRRYMGRRIYLVFFLALLSAASEGFGITLLLPLLTVVDADLGAAKSMPAGVTWTLEALGVAGSLTGILMLIGAAFLTKGVIAFAYGAYGGRLGATLQHELKSKVFAACSRMNYSYYVTRNTGHFVNIINGQVAGFCSCFDAYKSFAVQFIKAMAYLGIAMLLAWRFGLMTLVAGALFLGAFRAVNVRTREVSRKVSSELSVLNKLLVQTMQSFKYLSATDSMHRVGESVETSVGRLTAYRFHQQLWSTFASTVGEPVSILLVIAIVLVQVNVLEQPLAPILVAILLFHRGMGSLLSMQSQWLTVLGRVGAVEMVESELAALEGHREVGGAIAVGPLSKEIRLEGVSFRYAEKLGNVLSNVDLTIPARTTIALVGESGSGKSTLVDLVTLMLRPTSGTISIDGVSGRDVLLPTWRSQVGFVSQENVVFDETVASNIAMRHVDPGNTKLIAEIREAAKRAQIDSFVDGLPEGYFTVVGDRGVRLSGGQRQRLCIARELFRKPNILILDEATSALDSESEQGVQRGIDELHGEMTVVIIAHRLATVRNVDRIFVFANGKLVEQGDYDALRSNPDSRFSTMVELQSL